MPWDSSKGSVGKHNKKAAKSPKKRRAWSKVANKVLEKTGDEGRAIREANAVADRIYRGKK